MDNMFDAVGYLKRQGYIVANSYRLNHAYTINEIINSLSKASGTEVTEKQLRALLERNNISNA